MRIHSRRSHRRSRAPRAEPLESRLLLATFFVNSLDDVDDFACDASHCSLREAIQAANTEPDHDLIYFGIPGGGVPTIQPLSQLPAIIQPLTIDGSTQPAGLVEIDGALAGDTSDALHVSGGGSTLRTEI